MKRIFIIFLFIIFSSSSSLADNKKITVEEVESFFEYKFKERLTQRELFSTYKKENIKRLKEKRKEKRKERKEIKEKKRKKKRKEKKNKKKRQEKKEKKR